MKLTTEHIDAIREYLLSNVEGNLPADITSFLPRLKQILDDTVNEKVPTGLAEFVKSIDAEEQLEVFQQLQEAYREDQRFQKELQTAFLLNERAAIKRKFLETDLRDIKPGERQQLKDQFKEIENKKPAAPVIKFNWKKLAIAAAVIGALLAITFYVFDKRNNGKPEDIASVPATEKTKQEDGSRNRDAVLKQLQDDLAGINTPPVEKQITVLKESSLGYAAKEERPLLKQYDLQKALSTISLAIINIQGVTGMERTVDSLLTITDSLKFLINKYQFYNGVLTLYAPAQKDVKLFRIDGDHYMQVDNVIYECKTSDQPIALKALINNTIRERINKILFVTQN